MAGAAIVVSIKRLSDDYPQKSRRRVLCARKYEDTLES